MRGADIWLPPRGTVICPASAIEHDETRGFVLTASASVPNIATDKDKRLDMFIWHTQGHFYGFVNSCPHLGLPLETFPDRFLNAMGNALICSAHGAQFDATGACFAGPCSGDNLIRLELALVPQPADPSDAAPLDASLKAGSPPQNAAAHADKNIVLIGLLAHS